MSGARRAAFGRGYALGHRPVMDEVACHLVARDERLVILRIIGVDPGDFDVKAEPSQAPRNHVLVEEDERSTSHRDASVAKVVRNADQGERVDGGNACLQGVSGLMV